MADSLRRGGGVRITFGERARPPVFERGYVVKKKSHAEILWAIAQFRRLAEALFPEGYPAFETRWSV